MEGVGTRGGGDGSHKSRQATTKGPPFVLLDTNLFPRIALWCYHLYFFSFVKPQNLLAKDNKKSAKFSFWRRSKSHFSVPPSDMVSLWLRLQLGRCSFAIGGQRQLNKRLNASTQPSQRADLPLRLLPVSCGFTVVSVCVTLLLSDCPSTLLSELRKPSLRWGSSEENHTTFISGPKGTAHVSKTVACFQKPAIKWEYEI